MVVSSKASKTFLVFTGTDPECSVEEYLNAVTANRIWNLSPEPINTPLHENWIRRLQKVNLIGKFLQTDFKHC